MESYTIRNITVKENGNKIASLEEAKIKVGLERIEVNVGDLLCTSDTMGLIKLSSGNLTKEVEITGDTEDSALVIQRAILKTFSHEIVVGEPMRLKNVSFQSLRIVWNPKKQIVSDDSRINVRANVYDFDFWALNKVSWNNVTIEKVGLQGEYKSIRDSITKEGKHYQTGFLTIEVPPEKKTIEEAKVYSEGIISKLHVILAFAHGYDIPISGLKFYEVNAEGEELIGQENSIIWVGRTGANSSNVMSGGLDPFSK
jgi:hypothetical protein